MQLIESNQLSPTILKYFNDEIGDFSIDYVEFSINYLDEIIDKSTFIFLKDSEGNHSIGLNPSSFKSDEYYIPSHDVFIKDTAIGKDVANGRRSHHLYETIHLKVFKKNNESSFLKLKNVASDVKKIFEFLVGSPLHYTFIEFQTRKMNKIIRTPKIDSKSKNIVYEESEIASPEIIGRYFFGQMGEVKSINPTEFYKFAPIMANFDKILIQWFEKIEEHSFITQTYLNDLTLPYFWDIKLLNAIRNLEVFYRNFRETNKNTDDNLEKDRNKILNYISTNVSVKYRDKFQQQVQFEGETSLRKKLDNLFKELPDELFDQTVKKEGKSPSKSRSSLVSRLVQTRNYRTHGDNPEKYPYKITDPLKVMHTTRKLSLIQQFFILKELGLDDQSILKFQKFN